MKFGMFGGARATPGADDGYHQGYGAYIDAVVEAERLGYYSNFIVEHHFSGAGQVSSSLNLLSYMAAKTSRIRLGTAVVVLPWHNPVLVAEQAATLDLLSGGRFDFGVGKGYRHNEFEGFAIPIEEATERFEEAMTVIRKAWTSPGPFSHRGKYWQYENIVVEPATTQKPHPPLWLAAGRPESLRHAAREGYNLFLDQFQTFDVILSRLEIFRQALSAAGRAYDPMGVAVARGLFITRDDGEREAAIARRMKSQAVMNAFATAAGQKTKSSMLSDADLHKAAVDGLLLGTPKEIIARLKWLEARGVGYVLLSSPAPDGLRIFAEEVMPALT